MNLKARLLRWWDTVLGRPPWYRDENVTISRTDLYRDGESKPPPADSAAEGLSLLDESRSGMGRRRPTAGVNPYSNDAGFAKPHGWDRDGRG
jgi:hypothetical protein